MSEPRENRLYEEKAGSTLASSEALPQPQEVCAVFTELMETSSLAATQYLYKLGLSSCYINTKALAQNIMWTATSPYGVLECTINLSKPEKDPRAIAAEALQAQSSKHPHKAQVQLGKNVREDRGGAASLSSSAVPATPQCDLCWENEEFLGTPEHPAKPGLRVVPITLGRETWGLQYSPYAYFSEHCIALSKEHRPMIINDATFERLLDFVDLFPFYFIGANADLPIVGGSILSHDHFQGGCHEFPLMKAPLKQEFTLADLPEVQCGVVQWPASVVRLVSEDRPQLLKAASRVLQAWLNFSNEACSICAFTGEKRHNTLNPIVRKQDNTYIMDMVLRNNRSSEEHPWGIFHAPESSHHIKKENIGLIEIMGLAILPPRLLTQMPQVRDDASVQQEVAHVFTTILEATGVFKNDETGQAGWSSFIVKI